jgi:hypothetical protein
MSIRRNASPSPGPRSQLRNWRGLLPILVLAPLALAPKGCELSPEPCGGLLGLECQAGEYCDFPVAAQCGAADQWLRREHLRQRLPGGRRKRFSGR